MLRRLPWIMRPRAALARCSSVLADASPLWSRIPEDLVATLPTPALLVLMDTVRSNVRAVIDAAGGDPARWRPHLKTTKLRPVWRELLSAGVRSFKCATVREAALLLDLVKEERVAGVDLLVAYPLSLPNLRRLAEVVSSHAGEVRVSVLCEDAQGVAATSDVLNIWLDVNPLSYNRSGAPAEAVAQHAAAVAAAGERFEGVHYYDGHLDKHRCAAAYDELGRVVGRLPLAGTRFCGVEEVPRITSGTPTFEGALQYDWGRAPHQISPGTVVFSDLRTLERTDVGLRPAAVVLCRAVSRPADDVVTLDVGSKSVAAEMGDPCVAVLGRPDLTALKPSEEHLPVQLSPDSPRVERDTPFLLCPKHICPTVNLAEEAVLLDGGSVSFYPVEARAH